MYIVMYIMNMNIYITKENEKYLKSLPKGVSMSGLINKLIDMYKAENTTKKAKE